MKQTSTDNRHYNQWTFVTSSSAQAVGNNGKYLKWFSFINENKWRNNRLADKSGICHILATLIIVLTVNCGEIVTRQECLVHTGMWRVWRPRIIQTRMLNQEKPSELIRI